MFLMEKFGLIEKTCILMRLSSRVLKIRLFQVLITLLALILCTVIEVSNIKTHFAVSSKLLISLFLPYSITKLSNICNYIGINLGLPIRLNYNFSTQLRWVSHLSYRGHWNALMHLAYQLACFTFVRYYYPLVNQEAFITPLLNTWYCVSDCRALSPSCSQRCSLEVT